MKTKSKPLPQVGLAPYARREIGHAGFECKGSGGRHSSLHMNYHWQQAEWMLENKPLYYTGKLALDIVHLPQHLRHL